MNKNLLTFVIGTLSLIMINVQAQNTFFEPTNYVGALSSDASKDWTTGWTNFDPKNTSYPATTDATTLNAVDGAATSGVLHLTGSITLSASTVYLLKGFVVIDSLASLTIPAGTVIRGSADASSNNYATLVVHRGGKIFVNGTKESPVVMTSANAAGARERGDWGGLFIAGAAANNESNNKLMEGFDLTGISGFTEGHFGGSTSSDNSGSITYLRVEFGGIPFAPNKEINGVTFGSVGSATTVHHVQVSYSNDDSFEWFGGDVNCKYLIAYAGTDDDFDTDNGFSGKVQFGIGVRNRFYYDGTYAASSGASTSEGFESDNNASGTGAHPYTTAIFSNMTMIGPVPVDSTWSQLPSDQRDAFRRGARIRRNSRISVMNTIFMGYRNFLTLDGDSTLDQSGARKNPVNYNDNMQFKNNLIVNVASAYSPASASANGLVEVLNINTGTTADALTAANAWVTNSGNANNINPVAYTAGTVLENPSYRSTTPNFRPVANSPALAGADFTWAKFTGTLDFSNVSTFVGLPSTTGLISATPNSISNLSVTAVAITVTASNLSSQAITISIPATAVGFDLSTAEAGTYAQNWTVNGVARVVSVSGPASIGGFPITYESAKTVYDLPATMLYAKYTGTATSAIVTYVTLEAGATSALIALSNEIAPIVTVPASTVGSIEETQVSIYPNPSETGSVTIDLGANYNAAIVTISSIEGVIVKATQLLAGEGKTEISGLASGFYIATVNVSGSSKSFKLIVR